MNWGSPSGAGVIDARYCIESPTHTIGKIVVNGVNHYELFRKAKTQLPATR